MKKSTGITILSILVLLAPPDALALQLVGLSLATSVNRDLVPEATTRSFRADAPALHAVAVFADISEAVKISGHWIAVDAIDTPNYEIDSTDLKLRPGEARAHFQITRPDNGWPGGNYKLAIYVDDVFFSSIDFVISKRTNAGSNPLLDSGLSQADDGRIAEKLVGNWQCNMTMNDQVVGKGLMHFDANGSATLNAMRFRYQLQSGGDLLLQDQQGSYHYRLTFQGRAMQLTYEDGSTFNCQHAVNSAGLSGGQPSAQGAQTGNEWQLSGTFCSYGASSSYTASYSHSNRIHFDGRGHWTFGSESSFSGEVGMAYGQGDGDSGEYRVQGKRILYQTASGERGAAQVNMQQTNGQITEIYVEGELYSPTLCE